MSRACGSGGLAFEVHVIGALPLRVQVLVHIERRWQYFFNTMIIFFFVHLYCTGWYRVELPPPFYFHDFSKFKCHSNILRIKIFNTSPGFTHAAPPMPWFDCRVFDHTLLEVYK